jgi:hypothetical protein
VRDGLFNPNELFAGDDLSNWLSRRREAAVKKVAEIEPERVAVLC